jgi:hypothetical protein
MKWLEFRDVWQLPYKDKIKEVAPGLDWFGYFSAPDENGKLGINIEGEFSAADLRAMACVIDETEKAFAASGHVFEHSYR